ncbi:MAG: glycerophosphodiester phosphodiesterase family protein [Hyphomicrobiales bacterium]|nr:glycerophosphodiester phosphodiesterase family protein [Hyphomicrobiales bacterium]
MSGLSWLTAQHIAHRGLHDAVKGIVENTSSAVAAAMAADYAVEVDLRLAADGEAMVFHDSTLGRLTEEGGLVIGRNSEELQRIRFRGSGDRMMDLGQLIELVDGRTPLILEIKSQWDHVGPLEHRVAEVLRGYGGPVAVMSYDPDSLMAFIELAPDLPRGIVSERFRNRDAWPKLSDWRRFRLRHMLHSHRTRPQFVAYDIDGLPSAAPLLARHLFGLPLITWTVRTEADRRRAKLFADAMIFEGFLP